MQVKTEGGVTRIESFDIEEERENFGNRLRVVRELRGLTVEELAVRAEIPVHLVWDMECGIRSTAVTALKRLCIVLKVTADILLGLDAEYLAGSDYAGLTRKLKARTQSK